MGNLHRRALVFSITEGVSYNTSKDHEMSYFVDRLLSRDQVFLTPHFIHDTHVIRVHQSSFVEHLRELRRTGDVFGMSYSVYAATHVKYPRNSAIHP